MMQEQLLPVSGQSIEQAVSVLKAGGLVIGPSRSNYNIMCDPRNEQAVERVFEVKKRTKFGPLTVSISSLEGLDDLVTLPDTLDPGVLQEVWPSELTLIFFKSYPFPERLTCGAPTVGLTWQGESAMQTLTAAYGHPIAVTSANLSGMGTGLVDLEQALAHMRGKVDLILQGPPASPDKAPGKEIEGNTIIDLSFQPPVLVRQGLVPLERVRGRFPGLIEDPSVYPELLRARNAASSSRGEGTHE
ncbi:Threonylcarbamoyl-AMP synthase [compost metagenome]